MSFCKEFDSYDEAAEKYPGNNCKACVNNIFESDTGTQLCSIIKDNIEGGTSNEN